jgi:hypothetical protein
MTRRALVAGLIALSLGLLIVERFFPPGRRPYSADIDALHARFNEDAGKVRLLLLLSPT